MDNRLLAFLGISVLVAITPGPDIALVTRNALMLGRRGAQFTTLGVISAILIHTAAAALGLAVLLRTASTLFTVVKLAGAAYLVYLGLQALWPARRSAGGEYEPAELRTGVPRPRSAYWQGFLSALLNPKLLVFFATLRPQFARPGAAALPRMLLLGMIFAAAGLGWLSGYGALVTALRPVFSSRRVRRWMERFTGTVLVGLGARLALDRS